MGFGVVVGGRGGFHSTENWFMIKSLSGSTGKRKFRVIIVRREREREIGRDETRENIYRD